MISENSAQLISLGGSLASIYSAYIAHNKAGSYANNKAPVWPFTFFPLGFYAFLISTGYLPNNENSLVLELEISSNSYINITLGIAFIFSSLACLYADMVMGWAYSRKTRVNKNFNMFFKSLGSLVLAILVFNLVPWVGSSSVFLLLVASMFLSCLLWYQAARGANKVHHTPEALSIIAMVIVFVVPFIRSHIM